MLDIRGNSTDRRVARLSNFTERLFIFDEVACKGLEGLLQAFKCPDVQIQKEICNLNGRAAKARGVDFNNWKETQILWWQGSPYQRSSRDYVLLVTRSYDAVYEQDVSFKEDLLLIEFEEICHSIGNPDMRDTVLTEVEMLYQLNRLRIRALA